MSPEDFQTKCLPLLLKVRLQWQQSLSHKSAYAAKIADLLKDTLEAACGSTNFTGILVLFPRCLLHVLEVRCLCLQDPSQFAMFSVIMGVC